MDSTKLNSISICILGVAVIILGFTLSSVSKREREDRQLIQGLSANQTVMVRNQANMADTQGALIHYLISNQLK